MGCNNFSRDYALPSGHEVIVGVGWGPSAGRRHVRSGEMTKNASGSLKSFSVEERGSRALPQSSWCVHR